MCKSVLQCSYELIRKTWKRRPSHCLRAALGGFVFSCVELGTNVLLKMVGGKSKDDKGSEELGKNRGICGKYRRLSKAHERTTDRIVIVLLHRQHIAMLSA